MATLIVKNTVFYLVFAELVVLYYGVRAIIIRGRELEVENAKLRNENK